MTTDEIAAILAKDIATAYVRAEIRLRGIDLRHWNQHSMDDLVNQAKNNPVVKQLAARMFEALNADYIRSIEGLDL